VFERIDDKCECAVEIFAGSEGRFVGCKFDNNNKAAVVLRDRSKGYIDDCTFSNSQNTSILVLDSSVAQIKNCTFTTAHKFSVYLYRSSKGIIRRCCFLGDWTPGTTGATCPGKGIFMLKDTVGFIEDCQFHGCAGGGISIADGSEVRVTGCSFLNIKSSSIHGMKSCTVEVSRCTFESCHGNGVNFEFSSGFVTRCCFRRFALPALAIFGPPANPVICDCRIIGSTTIGVVARDASAPVFCRLLLDDIASHAFSLSDYARAHIVECVLTRIGGQPFAVFNGARPVIAGNVIESIHGPVWAIYTKGCPVLSWNTIVGDGPVRAKISNYGRLPDECVIENILRSPNGRLRQLGALVGGEFALEEIAAAPTGYSEEEAGLNPGPLRVVVGTGAPPAAGSSSPAEMPQNPVAAEGWGQAPEGDAGPRSAQLVRQPSASLSRGGVDSPGPIRRTPTPPTRRASGSGATKWPPIPRTAAIELRPAVAAPAASARPLSRVPSGLISLPRGPDFDVPQLASPSVRAIAKVDVDDMFDAEIVREDEPRTPGPGPCLFCGDGRLAERICAPCGHFIACLACAQRIVGESPPRKCEMCQTPVQACAELFPAEQCVVCLDHPSDTVILPCGHKCSCFADAVRLWEEKRQCPICTQRIVSFRHQFPIYEGEALDVGQQLLARKRGERAPG
jgi:hypothetical protein